MFGGNSGCSGIVIYNTKINGDNAIYGYYQGSKMCFETGTSEEMRSLRESREQALGKKSTITAKNMAMTFLAYLVVTIICFAAVSLKIGFAVLVFCLISYIPVMIIAAARGKLYDDPVSNDQFCRNHGCEHAIIQLLTHEKAATMENLRSTSYYDSECGTAYAGYAVLLAFELACLIVFWPGLLKSLLILAVTIAVLIILIINVKINPFTYLQRRVVSQPSEREYELGLELIKRMEELK